MKVPDRTFTTVHAEPGPRPLWVGIMGPSGGGKTFSALRLAKGIQSVIGGAIEFIDTESGRGKHYAELFDYQYTAFPPPHGSLDYLAAIEHATGVNKSKVIIIDSLSHEHEGEGGMIDFQEEEVERLTRGDASKEERVKMLAWTKPKQARKQLLRAMVAQGTSVVFILCFRADESSKPVKKTQRDGSVKTEVVQMGFMPIAGKPFVYECTVCALLMPGANGVPTWNPENVGEKMMRKLPEQFRDMFGQLEGKPLSEEVGVELAKWSLGGAKPEQERATKQPQTLAERTEAAKAFLLAAKSGDSLEKRWKNTKSLCDELRDPIAGVDPHLFADLKKVYEECAAKFAPKGAPAAAPIVPEVVQQAERTARIVALAKKARDSFFGSNDGDAAKANKALADLSEGGCGDFNKLSLYLADNPLFERVIEDAIGGGE